MSLDSSRIRLIIGGILTASIALNFFCLGWYASNVVLADRVPAFIGGPPPPRGMTQREAEVVASWTGHMSEGGARLLNRAFDSRRNALTAAETELETAIAALKDSIKAEPFALETVRRRLADVRDVMRRRTDVVAALMADILPSLGAEDRAVIADIRPGPMP